MAGADRPLGVKPWRPPRARLETWKDRPRRRDARLRHRKRDFPVGASLPAEHDLERQYGASRGVVREAVKILAGKGLVSVGPRIGTRVRPTRDWNLLDHDVLAWLGEGGLDRDLMLALGETRVIIEPAAAALAAERATAAERRAIRAAYAEMAAHQDDIPRATAADKAFHLAVLDATHNPVLGSFRTAIDAILSAVFEPAVPMLGPNLPNHEAVLVAIERNDPVAARHAMEQVIGYTQHLLSGEDGRGEARSRPPLEGEEAAAAPPRARSRLRLAETGL